MAALAILFVSWQTFRGLGWNRQASAVGWCLLSVVVCHLAFAWWPR